LLLVEDDPGAARALVRLVREHCEVSLAATASEAREQLASGSLWRAFILDDGLPDGSGVDLLVEWRPVYPDTPALVLTGCTHARVINAVFDARADYLVKPAEAQRVLRFLLQPRLQPGSRPSTPAPVIRDGSPLALCIDRLRELQVGQLDARSRYRMGAIVAEVKRRTDLYGTRGVPALATGIGEAEQNLYRYATVAERWTPEEFEVLVSRRGGDGRCLSWSHLVLIASIDDDVARTRLLERVLDDSLSVRALMAIVNRSSGSGSDRGSTPG
jgi:ActR/RegA family two-component response regulator